MFVLKFGGSSVGTHAAIENVVRILKDPRRHKKVALVVVSAFSGVTDGLIEMSRLASHGDSSYMEAALALKKRHEEAAVYFLTGDSLTLAMHTIKAHYDELLRVLDGVSVLREFSPRSRDLVMSFGERFSASLIAPILSSQGLPAIYLDSRLVVKTDDQFGKAAVSEGETFKQILSWFETTTGVKDRSVLPVATGFIGSAPDGSTTTLGRGGSDLSVAVFGAALDVEEIEIWTDVDGILTTDPRHVKNAFPIKSISYEEAMELSHFGAKVIYPPTIKPALAKGIPIRIKNTFNPESEGTLIVNKAEQSPYPIRGISSMSHVALVRVQGSAMVGATGFSSRLFGALALRKISVILITQSSSEYSICLAVLPSDVSGAEQAIYEEFAKEIAQGVIDPPATEKNLSIVAVVGSKMKSTPGVSGKVFHALGRNGINIVAISQGSSEINISAVISFQDEGKALNAIHEAFFHSRVRSLNLFLIGTGHIGNTLLEQIAKQQQDLETKHKIRINLVAAADSRRAIFCPKGLDPATVKQMLKSESSAAELGVEEVFPLELPQFIEKMKAMNLPNSAFCDCTANDDVSSIYEPILRASIPVITPNKRSNSLSFEYYKTLREISQGRGVPYLYETTVCAGLPVISTIRDLNLAGDTVRRIEAVLSGTLSFIFNNFDGSKPFSALVKDAKARGYTEPDPRDDLNAKDAARKALILARECGMQLEFPDVQIDPIIPAACFHAETVHAFFDELEKCDEDFELRRKKAADEGKALRYVAVIEDNSVKLSLKEEPFGSPFLTLKDADNIVVITTDRYSALPIVIKGPGAGAQVTAGGVFADIIRIARPLV
ncbi:MAG: bifunctional aspartate kinase/homoserine dehydrogenase I [Treponema sp.]|jgi:aspartokinase/homoserine dehydrogenase 1|nr:bifunctional aspartate kinase/homoserine dehydrogenase I [Treponema sp.]